ncbi:nucleoside triphosphate pyrophosphohydrolase family protein [Leptospira meyeri]|uniref:nucleoside triphosphate pyrophosphohydrolase family protein n=1 Tax=Leptospira meyeri TaxID=29508 RepID=UPI0013FE344D|nr:nucleoside triphosphate pyrophosphohydrolase family protein [Leptospira meyeri]
MDFEYYQKEAEKTIQKYLADEKMNQIIPFLGIIGEAGSVLTELKKKLRDGEGYASFSEKLSEELGDVLWYISAIASQNKISLAEIAKNNLRKTTDRFSEEDNTKFITYDENNPLKEQFPREFEIKFVSFEEDGKSKVRIEGKDGKKIGDILTDNAYEDDGYRFHDIFHFGYVAYLGWSPVVRKLMEIKRRSDEKKNEIEDGGRALITEELITLYIYNHAQNHRLFKYSDRVDTEVLKTVQKLVSKIEVSDCTAKQWEICIINSYKVFDELKKNNGGRVLVSVQNKKMFYLGIK